MPPNFLQQQVNALSAQVAQLSQFLMAQQQGNGPANLPSFPNKLIVPFTYMVTIVGIAPGIAAQQPIQMAADSVFELLRIVCVTSADNPTDFAPNNCSIQMTDGSTGQLLSSAAIPQAMAVTRSYQYGNDEKYPIQFPALAIVQVSITNLLLAPLTVNFGLRGYKIFQKTA